MVPCRDASLGFLNDKGYNVVRVPRAGIVPLDLLGRDGGALEWLGTLGSLWQSPRPLPVSAPPAIAVDIEGRRTDSLRVDAGLSLLKGVLSLLDAGAGLDAAYEAASTIEFAYANVRSIRVAPLEIGAFLADGSTDRRNPVIERFFLGGGGEGFVLTEVLQSDRLKVTARRNRGAALEVDVDRISAALGANAGVRVSRAAESALVYAREAPVTFAFRLLAIAHEAGRWTTRGAAPGADLSFEPGEVPPAPPLAREALLEIAAAPSIAAVAG